MKKIVAFVVIAYFVVGGALLLLDEPANAVVRLLTVERPHAIFLADAEDVFAFSLYVDDPAAYVTDPLQIVGATLEDGTNALALLLEDVVRTGETVTRDGVLYHEYRYVFTPDGVGLGEGALGFAAACLCLTYENGESGRYAVGDVEIVFGTPGDPRHLDFTRLYGIFNDEDGKEALAGFVIGLSTGTGTGVELLGIELHCPGIAASLGEAVVLATAPDAATPVGTLLSDPERKLVGTPVDGTLTVTSDTLLFVPVVHAERLRPATRFPVVLVYRYDGASHRFAIDDFAFRNPFPFPEDYGEAVHAYEHRR